MSDYWLAVLVGAGLGAVAVAAWLLHTAIARHRHTRGALDPAKIDFESQAFLAALYATTHEPGAEVPVGGYWRARGLNAHQAYVVVTELIQRGSVVVRYSDQWSMQAARFLCLAPTRVILARREYDERSVAAGIGRALGPHTRASISSLSTEQLEHIAAALAQDGARGIADAVVAAIRADNKPSAVDTVLKVVSAISDGQALWQITANVVTAMARAF
ncbi:hypothetical protein [Cellulomonas sp. PS-H5]|uniref:hypothetical protein n=1 Tax=Cellulomonas sp. PS-H5 TaxID=2820400 RepID=UPI001C4FCE67|nr:hypothetical protein [Cellulomonas sp. PS-H5]MBW0255616.1 hypothetical protein [Cellulomonas sp. PS-H5]